MTRVSTIALLLLLLAGCSSPSPNARTCTLTLSGNVAETSRLGKDCAKLEPSAGGYALEFEGSTHEIQALAFRVDLGEAPTVGAYSPATVGSWSASALQAGDTSCILSAGEKSVPQGYFTLDLESVEGHAGGVAHGSLDLVMSVRAPPATDCGPGDTEHATLQF